MSHWNAFSVLFAFAQIICRTGFPIVQFSLYIWVSPAYAFVGMGWQLPGGQLCLNLRVQLLIRWKVDLWNPFVSYTCCHFIFLFCHNWVWKGTVYVRASVVDPLNRLEEYILAYRRRSPPPIRSADWRSAQPCWSRGGSAPLPPRGVGVGVELDPKCASSSTPTPTSHWRQLALHEFFPNNEES
jgi:hypothetical protein